MTDAHNNDEPPLPPEGLLRDIAQFIYQQAPRQVPEIALAGSLGYFAAIVSRAYNVLGMGLNQYIILLARTGRGKDAISSGIRHLTRALTDTSNGEAIAPTASNFIGPDMASGQGLLRMLGDAKRQPVSCVSIMLEFGIRHSQMVRDNATDANRTLLSAFLMLYTETGKGRAIEGVVYSNPKDNIPRIEAPNLNILAESTPSEFYDHLNERSITSGFIPRCGIIEYTGVRPPANEKAAVAKPSADLLQKLGKLIAKVNTLNSTNKVIDVEYEPDAKELLRNFDKFADAQFEGQANSAFEECWNRAHVKAEKLAALAAVSRDFEKPTITLEMAQWACDQVALDIRKLLSRFENGQVGIISRVTAHDKQTEFVLRKIVHWSTCEFGDLPKDSHEGLHRAKFVPWRYISQQCASVAAFKNDIDTTRAIRRAVENLIREERIEAVEPKSLEPFDTRMECFVLKDLGAV